MNWFTKQVPSSALIARLEDKDVAAARKYLQRYLDNVAVDQRRLMQAVALLVMDHDNEAGHA